MMKARDIMTGEIVTIDPDMPLRQVAQTLSAHGISAAPVVGADGDPIGMVSEGDLIARNDKDREARRDWWLTLLAEGEALHPDFLANMRQPERRARDVMVAPVISVGEATEITEIARLLVAYGIKRVPVVRQGRVVGIVSRADLVRALAEEAPRRAAPQTETGSLFAEALAGIERHFRHDGPAPEREARFASRLQPEPEASAPKADEFRRLVAEHEVQERQHRREARLVAAEERQHRVAELLDLHLLDAGWRALLHQARLAAEHGEKQFLLLRFPSRLCSDGGRAINAGESDWPATLRGEAAELYLRWERDLKPHGFGLAAEVLEFPDGLPGDIGLFLIWGD